MFTGIVTDIGEVAAVERLAAGIRLRIATTYDPDTIALGASIACSGPCLTVVATGRAGARGTFDVEASSETLARTTMAQWSPGVRVNLERSLRMGDGLGGHMVTGHIDGTAAILERRDEGGMAAFTLEASPELARYIAQKGSVGLDGTSLTVNSVDGPRFQVMLIPHTLAVTTWADRRPGDHVNLEVDVFARYLERLREGAA